MTIEMNVVASDNPKWDPEIISFCSREFAQGLSKEISSIELSLFKEGNDLSISFHNKDGSGERAAKNARVLLDKGGFKEIQMDVGTGSYVGIKVPNVGADAIVKVASLLVADGGVGSLLDRKIANEIISQDCTRRGVKADFSLSGNKFVSPDVRADGVKLNQ